MGNYGEDAVGMIFCRKDMEAGPSQWQDSRS